MSAEHGRDWFHKFSLAVVFDERFWVSMVNSTLLNTTNILVIVHSSRCDWNVSHTTEKVRVSTDFEAINSQV